MAIKKLISPGDVFHWLTVIGKHPGLIYGKQAYLCRCKCGAEKITNKPQLLRGFTKSCGCYRVLVSGNKNRTHGRSGESIYNVWLGMISRCYKPSDISYKRYGGRGITVCDRWRDSFANFLADMGDKPSEDMQLDRIDNFAGYSPGNCHWTTRVENNRNTRSNKILSVGNFSMPEICWAKALGIGRATLSQRLVRGWTLEKAITTPIDRSCHHLSQDPNA